MKWLWKHRFSWADLIGGVIILHLFDSLLVIFIAAFVMLMISESVTNKLYHESLPRSN